MAILLAIWAAAACAVLWLAVLWALS